MEPVLYTFRRCPYAMRARLALYQAGIRYEHREVELKAKPEAMLRVSPKGTVPVLIRTDGTVIDESYPIMLWALQHADPDHWLEVDMKLANDLIQANDTEFKPWLDRYKYPVRFTEQAIVHARDMGVKFIEQLERRLTDNSALGLADRRWTLADAAIFPFVRQFAGVDRQWFDTSPYQQTGLWLRSWEQSSLFEAIMKKHRVWQEETVPAG